MDEFAKCLKIINSTSKMLKFIRILFFAVISFSLFRIGFTVFKTVKK